MLNFFKGFIIGIGKIIPGVSGAMLAAIMGVYDKSLYYICNFRKNIKESIKYLSPIAVGILLSIILFSKVISICLDKYYVITMFFFIGLVIGGLPFIINKINKKNKKDYSITIISFSIFFFLSIFNINNNYTPQNNFIDIIIYILSGLLEAIGTIVPGVSSAALLMIVGTYDQIVYSIGNITNIKLIITFSISTIIFILLLMKIVEYLFRKYNNKMYSFVLGVLSSSIILLIIQVFKNKVSIITLSISLIFMVLGIIITNLFKEK